jgi:hypothetical protein
MECTHKDDTHVVEEIEDFKLVNRIVEEVHWVEEENDTDVVEVVEGFHLW